MSGILSTGGFRDRRCRRGHVANWFRPYFSAAERCRARRGYSARDRFTSSFPSLILQLLRHVLAEAAIWGGQTCGSIQETTAASLRLASHVACSAEHASRVVCGALMFALRTQVRFVPFGALRLVHSRWSNITLSSLTAQISSTRLINFADTILNSSASSQRLAEINVRDTAQYPCREIALVGI